MAEQDTRGPRGRAWSGSVTLTAPDDERQREQSGKGGEISTAKVSVIVPVRNDREGLCALLARLAAQTLPQDRFEIVVGDDGSEPDSLAGIATHDGRVRVLSGPPQTSYAARNRACHAASGSILAFCDADCLPDPTWLERGLDALSGADLVAGQIVFQPPRRPTVWSLLTMDMFLDQERNVRFSMAVTANLFVRRSAFEHAGGFDDSLPSGGDHDFTRRAVSHGRTLRFAPDAIVRHPTLNSARTFLRKVWFTNHWWAVRSTRAGLRPQPAALVEFVPVLGVAMARRRVLRPIAGLCRPRLVAAGLIPGWREDVKAIPVLYFVVAYIAGAALFRGWLRGRRMTPSPTARPERSPSAAGAHPARRRSPTRNALPNLVVIGAQKCGTGSLHYYLGLHPEISMSHRKELNFFIEEANWQRGVDWYRQWFDSASVINGESSPNYSAFPRYSGVPARMASVIPDTRIIYLVRDPIERIASHWVHNYAQRRELADLPTTLLDPRSSYVARSCYYLQLKRYLEHFDRSQILVVDSHDLRHNRLHTLRRIFEFLGVNPDLYHPGFERMHHSSELKRRATPFGLRLRQAVRPWIRRGPAVTLWQAFETAMRLSHPIEILPDIPDGLGEAALARLHEDAEQFRALTRMSFDHWTVFNQNGLTEASWR